MRLFLTLGLGVVVVACAPARLEAPIESGARKPSNSDAAASSAAASTAPKELSDLQKELEAEGVTGTIALYDSQDGGLGCSDAARCQQAFVPASTFEIAHSMLALETGVIDGPDSLLKWDGQQYAADAWNQDLKLRDAFRVSCVPCYRALARQVGEKVAQEWVDKLDYGSRDISGGVDRFWLSGGLRISPLQQIDFLRRFDGNELPISERTADIVRDIMTLDVTETYVLRGKTGSTIKPEGERDLFWFVGWIELGERRVFFATLLDGHRRGVDPLPLGRRVTERVLRARGLLGEKRPP